MRERRQLIQALHILFISGFDTAKSIARSRWGVLLSEYLVVCVLSTYFYEMYNSYAYICLFLTHKEKRGYNMSLLHINTSSRFVTDLRGRMELFFAATWYV